MAIAKGQRLEGGGRPKGSGNKTTKELKDMILGALDKAGGQKYLQAQATQNPVAFMNLVGKILPKDIKASVDGDITITSITRKIVDAHRDSNS